MANLPPPNNDPNIPQEDQLPVVPDEFAPQWIGGQDPNNNNGWIEEVEEEMEEEEEIDIDNEDEAEVIYPYDDVSDPNNRPPPASDDESEFAPAVIPVVDTENRPVPPIIHFGRYELGESSSTQEILMNIGKVCPIGPGSLTIGTAMNRIRKLNKQMIERTEVDKRIVKKIDRSDLRIRMIGRDAMMLDGAVRECRADISKVISMVEGMSLEFERVRKESRRALELAEWEARVREEYLPKLRLGEGFVESSAHSFRGPFPDDPYVRVRNADMTGDDDDGDDGEGDDDMDDDTDPIETQSSEPHGSPRDS